MISKTLHPERQTLRVVFVIMALGLCPSCCCTIKHTWSHCNATSMFLSLQWHTSLSSLGGLNMTTINFVHSAHIINVTRSIYDAGIYKALTGDKELKYNDYFS